MKIKTLLKSLLIIFLIANFGFIQGEQVTVLKNTDTKILIENELNVPLNSSNKAVIVDNILFKRLLDANPDLTVGQVSAFSLMINKQMNQSKQFDYKLYLDYLNSSSEYPIEGFNLTARELYNISPPVKDFIDKLDEQVVKFSKLSREEMTEYLLTETPSAETSRNILANADVNEILYYMNDLDILANMSSNISNVNILNANKIGKRIHEEMNQFNHNISIHREMYKMDLMDDKVNTSLTNFSKNSSLEKIELVRDNLAFFVRKFDDLVAGLFILLAFCIIFILLCIGIAISSLGAYIPILVIAIVLTVLLASAIVIISASLHIFIGILAIVDDLYREIKLIIGG